MNLKLFVAAHKAVDIPCAAYLYPIRSDRTDGENIAAKASYCELRAQYWVWKNERLSDEDYAGFFHYRRYLDLDRKKLVQHSMKTRKLIPYQIKKAPRKELYSNPEVLDFVNGYEIIAPIWEYTGVPVWERYQKSSKQRIEDLEMIYQIILEEHPDFSNAADSYLSGKGEYYGNIYIMRWDRFQKYCAWLFNILEEFDRRMPDAPFAADGFLGERLFGIYFTWLTDCEGMPCAYLPRLHFSLYDDQTHHAGREQFFNLFLPPGSTLRSWARKLRYRLGE